MRLSLSSLCVMGAGLMSLPAQANERPAAPPALPDTRPPEMQTAPQSADGTFARAAQPSASAPVKAVTQIPEPGTWALMGMGLVAVALARQRRQR